MKNFFLTIILSLSTLFVFAQKSSGTIRDDDENSKNIKALNKDYSENKFILWESLVADDAVIYINNNKLPKVVVLEAFKGHHAIFNDIQIENSYVHTNYFKSKHRSGASIPSSLSLMTSDEPSRPLIRSTLPVVAPPERYPHHQKIF